MNPRDALDLAIRLARDVGDFAAPFAGTSGAPRDLDRQCQTRILDGIVAAFPRQHFWLCAEERPRDVRFEAGVPPPGEWRWIVDPIDGSGNFGSRGAASRVWSVSIALASDRGIEFGVLRFPILDELWVASDGRVELNGAPLSPPSAPPGLDAGPVLLNVSARGLRHRFSRTEYPGCVTFALTRIARGDAAAWIAGHTNLWDVAAAGCVLTALGGVLADSRGEPLPLATRGEAAIRARVLAAPSPAAMQCLIARVGG